MHRESQVQSPRTQCNKTQAGVEPGSLYLGSLDCLDLFEISHFNKQIWNFVYS